MKIMTNSLLPVFFVLHLTSYKSFAQEKHHIGMGLGLSFFQNKDYLASPLTYRGLSPALNLFYQYKGDPNNHALCFSYRSSDLSTSISQTSVAHIVHHIGLRAEYRYHRLINSWSRKRAHFYIGGILHQFFSRRAHLYNRDFDHIFISFISSMDISIRYDFDIFKIGSVFSQFDIPLLAIWVREPYSIKGPLTVQCTSLHQFLGFRGQWGFTWSVSYRINVQFMYDLVYYQYTEPQKTRTGMDCFCVSIVLKY